MVRTFASYLIAELIAETYFLVGADCEAGVTGA
jgi:hypothetical protein